MSRITTMGTKSCATIAICGFKIDDLTLNELYNENPRKVKKGEGLSVNQFYNEVLYPTSQPFGETADYPFDWLMKELEKSSMRNKFIITTLNHSQTLYKNGYWVKKLNEYEFELIDMTNNTIGEMCYIYARNRNQGKMKK